MQPGGGRRAPPVSGPGPQGHEEDDVVLVEPALDGKQLVVGQGTVGGLPLSSVAEGVREPYHLPLGRHNTEEVTPVLHACVCSCSCVALGTGTPWKPLCGSSRRFCST